jgi:rootletin
VKRSVFCFVAQAFNDYYNSEHNRLVKMWKEVVAVKRVFKEMASVTKIDLGKIRCEIAGTVRELGGATVNMRNASKLDVSRRI